MGKGGEVEIETWREGPGSQPGMARRAEAGPREAASVVVATMRVTISPASLLVLLPLVVSEKQAAAFLRVVQLAALNVRCALAALSVRCAMAALRIRCAHRWPIASMCSVPRSRKATNASVST